MLLEVNVAIEDARGSFRKGGSNCDVDLVCLKSCQVTLEVAAYGREHSRRTRQKVAAGGKAAAAIVEKSRFLDLLQRAPA